MIVWLNKAAGFLRRETSRRRIYIHEDDCCQQEILPIENWHDCAEQIGAIEESAAKSFDGTSWGSIVLRDAPAKNLFDLGIEMVSLRALLESRLPKYDLVQTGFGAHVEDCKNTEAFGMDHGFSVFVSYNPAGVVTAIWCRPWGLEKHLQESRNPLLQVFAALSAQFDLLFVDWAWGRMYRLGDQLALGRYLDEHIRHQLSESNSG